MRRLSHIALPLEQRNVTLYCHIGVAPEGQDTDIELIDEHIYRTAYNKLKHMSKVHRLLKRNAIDCGLNIYGNIFINKFYTEKGIPSPLKDRGIIDSKGHKRIISLTDKNKSFRCDFMDCDYGCIPDDYQNKKEHINEDTFNLFFMESDIMLIKEFIKQMFRNQYALEDTEIIKNVKDSFPLIDKNTTDNQTNKIIYKALNDLVENKEEMFDMYNKEGYIIEKLGYYIFQPSVKGSQKLDDNAPLKYRYLPQYKRTKSTEVIPPILKTETVDTSKTQTKQVETAKIVEIFKKYLKYAKENFETLKLFKWYEYGGYMLLNYLEGYKYPKINDKQLKINQKKRLQLLKEILEYTIKEPGFSTLRYKNDIEEEIKNSKDITSIDNDTVKKYMFLVIFYNYYTRQDNSLTKNRKKFSYFIDEKMIDINSTTNNIIGLLYLYTMPKGNIIYKMFTINKNTNEISQVNSRQFNKRYKNKLEMSIEEQQLKTNNNEYKLLGYNQQVKNKVKFYLLIRDKEINSNYNIQMRNLDGRISKRYKNKGKICKNNNNTQLKKIIKNIYKNYTNVNVTKEEINRIKEEKLLCTTINVILRYLDNNPPENYENYRFFYRIEEMAFIKNKI